MYTQCWALIVVLQYGSGISREHICMGVLG